MTALIQAYFFRIKKILIHPVVFFREMPTTGGLVNPLCFALCTHWIGAAFNYLVRMFIGETGRVSFQNYFDRFGSQYGSQYEINHAGRSIPWNQISTQLLHWFYGVSAVIIDPFFTLGSILFTSSLVFMGARIFVSPSKDTDLNRVSYESAVRIISYGMAPTLLAGVPVFGTLIAWGYTWIVTLMGAREVYRTTTGKAIIISLFPKLLFIGIIGIGLILMILFFFQLIAWSW